MFGSVRPETGNAHINQMIEELSLLVPDIFFALINIAQSAQTAVACLLSIVVIVNVQTFGWTRVVIVEVVGTEWDARILKRVTVPGAASGSVA